MSLAVPSLRVVGADRPTVRRQPPVPRLMLLAWGALVWDVMTFGGAMVLPLPGPIGQMITQGCLIAALVLGLMANRRQVLRPNLFLALYSMLAVVSFMMSVHNEFFLSSVFRASRLVGFVLALWIFTAWWGRRDMLLLRCHRRCLWIVVATIYLGILVSPGLAFSYGGRLSGVIWPILPTQVGHYGAVLFGTTAILWMCNVISGRHAALGLTLSFGVLVLSHTRTALLGTIIGLLVAGASLFLGHARVRRVSALTAVGAVLGATVFASQLTAWALRGQSAQEAGQLTGRTKVWQLVFSTPRPKVNDLFGSGLSNQSFQGLPIDSNWVATFFDQGYFGMVVEAAVLLLLLLMAATRERGPQRATALFLVVYCLVASFTETGLGIPSPYMLDLAVAASLLAPEPRRRVW